MSDSVIDAGMTDLMLALSLKRTSDCRCVMSALPPKADIAERDRHVRFVPKADIRSARQPAWNELWIVRLGATEMVREARKAKLK